MSQQAASPQPDTDTPRSCTTAGDGSCLGCGAHVSDHFQRVCGDNEGNVYRCPDCDGQTNSQTPHWAKPAGGADE